MSAAELAYFDLFGEPLFKVVGMAAFTALFAAALVPVLNRRGLRLPMQAHFRLAWAGLLLAAAHISLILAA
ncbi:MAG: hypothetical protein FD189_2426 [Elusimicrobia bacterium]|nr:MAG: hypothetical protein FD154_2303 [Elusimicrobiota bacterium]KAF0152920.1 MAG: hypothetical protein FD189_2426 [Elusimicrobiota bacterium]